MDLVTKIKANPGIKRRVHWLLIPSGEARPRWWVNAFMNPFYHQRGKSSKIRSTVRKDVLPFHKLVLGEGSVIEDFSVVNNGMGDVKIGARSFVGMHNTIIGPVEIGSNVITAQHVVISGLNHSYEDAGLPIKDQPCVTKNIVIGDDCWIGANAVITAGVRVGKHAVVAAGSVVTKPVPDFSIVAGNPARVIKTYNFNLKQWEKVLK
jgi:acetyltransferase-like isoleucine patch superfamily enzyme